MNYEFNLLHHVGVVAKRVRAAVAAAVHEGDNNTTSGPVGRGVQKNVFHSRCKKKFDTRQHYMTLKHLSTAQNQNKIKIYKTLQELEQDTNANKYTLKYPQPP